MYLLILMLSVQKKISRNSFLIIIRGGLGDVKVKKFLNNVLQKQLEPIRNKRHEYEKDIPGVYEILRKGTEAAYEVAQQTLNEVKASMKINYFDDAQLIKVQSEKYSGIED